MSITEPPGIVRVSQGEFDGALYTKVRDELTKLMHAHGEPTTVAIGARQINTFIRSNPNAAVVIECLRKNHIRFKALRPPASIQYYNTTHAQRKLVDEYFGEREDTIFKKNEAAMSKQHEQNENIEREESQGIIKAHKVLEAHKAKKHPEQRMAIALQPPEDDFEEPLAQEDDFEEPLAPWSKHVEESVNTNIFLEEQINELRGKLTDVELKYIDSQLEVKKLKKDVTESYASRDDAIAELDNEAYKREKHYEDIIAGFKAKLDANAQEITKMKSEWDIDLQHITDLTNMTREMEREIDNKLTNSLNSSAFGTARGSPPPENINSDDIDMPQVADPQTNFTTAGGKVETLEELNEQLMAQTKGLTAHTENADKWFNSWTSAAKKKNADTANTFNNRIRELNKKIAALGAAELEKLKIAENKMVEKHASKAMTADDKAELQKIRGLIDAIEKEMGVAPPAQAVKVEVKVEVKTEPMADDMAAPPRAAAIVNAAVAAQPQDIDDQFERVSRDNLVSVAHLRLGRNPEALPIRHQDLRHTLGVHLGRLRADTSRNKIITKQRVDMAMLDAYTVRPRFTSF